MWKILQMFHDSMTDNQDWGEKRQCVHVNYADGFRRYFGGQRQWQFVSIVCILWDCILTIKCFSLLECQWSVQVISYCKSVKRRNIWRSCLINYILYNKIKQIIKLTCMGYEFNLIWNKYDILTNIQ